ncbi:MAG: tyrosine-type recombinase/integrase, partial [Nitrosotalea sp.]
MIKKATVLTHEDFLNFLESVPKIDLFSGKHRRPSMPAYELQMLYKLLFYCALKANDVVNLKKNDFDLENSFLTIKSTGNVPQNTTIPPILWGDIKNFLKNKRDEEFLFVSKYTEKPVTRQNVWEYAKDVGKLAGLNVFTVTQTKEIEGISLLLFRESYQ